MSPWGVRWPSGEIFHSASTCALWLGFQGLGVSSLHLLPLGQSSRHSGLLGVVGWAAQQRVRGWGIRLALAPGGPTLGGRGPQIGHFQQYRQPELTCSKRSRPCLCVSQEDFELQAQGLLLLVWMGVRWGAVHASSGS